MYTPLSHFTSSSNLNNMCHDIWVFGEHHDRQLAAVTRELLGVAQRLAAVRGCAVVCVLFGEDVMPCVASAAADVVLVMEDARLASFVDDIWARNLAELITTHRPEMVLCGATSLGRALMPNVAVRVRTGLTADCTALEIDLETGHLLQTRPAFGGNIMATIACPSHRPQMATVRPHVFQEPVPDTARVARVEQVPFVPSELDARSRLLGTWLSAEDGVRLSDARFIVAGGRGMGGAAGFALLESFARAVGGAVGASRAAVDAGWISYDRQIGQTGQTIQPSIYCACGISGQIQHLVGMQSSDYIIAINRDANAPIMQVADLAVCGDVFEVLPCLLQEWQTV